MSEHNIGEGNVEIELDGETYTMRPTLKAAIALTNVQGGIPMQTQRCLNCEMDAIVNIVSHGLGISSKDLPEKIFRTGLFKLSAPCIRFLHILGNGGRQIKDDEEEGGKAPLEQTD